MRANDDLSSISLDHLRQQKNWQSIYREITRWGNLISEKPDLRNEQYKISACDVNTWLYFEKSDEGLCCFWFDSESRVINGMGALVLSQVQNQLVEVIDKIDWREQFNELGLSKHLTPSRSNGVRAIVNRVYEYIALPKRF